MLFFNFPRFLKQKGVARPFSYFKSLGYSPGTATKMSQNRITSVTISKLEEYCIQFHCTPNDLCEYRPDPANILPHDHPLNSLIREELTNEINALLHTLPLEKIRELAALIKNTP